MKPAKDMIDGAMQEAGAAMTPREVNDEEIAEWTRRYKDAIIKLGYDDSAGVLDTLSAFCAYYRLDLARRGLLLIGNVGTGKTFAMQLLARLFPARLRIVTAQEIVDEHKAAGRDGDKVKEKYGRIRDEDWSRGYWDGHSYIPLDLIIDDIGCEHTRNEYGEQYELIAHIIAIRDRQYREIGAKTFFTTNQDLDQLAERYDSRTRSRIEGLCTVIPFQGSDRRGDG